MEAELVALATTGATTLVQQMATEGWGALRRRMAALLARRRGAEAEAVGRELDETRAEVVNAQENGDELAVEDAVARWRIELRRLFAEDPAAAAELRRLLDEVAPRNDQGATVRDVHNTVSGGVSGMVVQAGIVSNVHPGNRPGGPHAR
ncbi:hypothetical protein K2224_25535 [Streptomyces sp. BHT-5-2]|uniref:hypothetical protein n=1 Tax=unclassified Streptomyces TaxID=2593676 RepID=UPI001C8E2F22|nr:hypothetical protein [Streptomyces sp. BHT-5-2]QZL06112.1 hypothetical protein K2224_25535 [Streptomyces sp. BHT-5-2]